MMDADLTPGADLTGANLSGTHLTGAKWAAIVEFPFDKGAPCSR